MRDDWESSQAAQLRVAASPEGAEAVITLEGELDHSTAKVFVACVLEVNARPSRHVFPRLLRMEERRSEPFTQ